MPCYSFINLLLLAVMAVVCGVAESSLEKYYSPLGAPWLYGDNLSDDNPRINGLTTLVFALITFQNIVPISLYISIEFVRTAQAVFIYFDKEIWYEKTGQATIPRSWNLSDDLGQIEYIFSDKTGTLTQVRAIRVNCESGIDFGHLHTLRTSWYLGSVQSEARRTTAAPRSRRHRAPEWNQRRWTRQ
jgi:phospholipid-translocating ATPase